MAGLQSYDVFLSCCGSDTRHGFTGHLLKALRDKGIHTFIEDEGLPRGDEIVPAVFKAIEESRLAIIVFSENYAASSLRLEELAHILHICQQNRRSIIPVFYEVNPSDVRKQRGYYEKAFARHEMHFEGNMDKLRIWRNALHQVASLSGWHFRRGDGYEFQFIERIVGDVSTKLCSAPLHVAGHLVGLDSRLKEVCSLLELESSGVLMVGIHGMAGIGKTTLVREVYNKIVDQFVGSCFLDHVRENSNKHGLVHLQNKLLFEIVGEKNIQLGNVNRGATIRHRLHQKKVLLILDDVDKLEQLEALVGGLDWFGSGSKIIITTRDKHLLAFHGVERRYEVQALNQRDALELLSHRVFKLGNVDPSYTEILNNVVTYASGLPLALEVIGSSFMGRSVDECRFALDRFKRIPDNEIQHILRASFDALEEEEQSVFLDIACCFNGYELAEVEAILHAHHGYDMKYHIELLIDKSLISISSDSKVTLHPLIEDMGKEIVRQESPKHPGKRSRLWFPEDIAEVLKENTGTSNIEIIHMDSPLSEEEEVIEWDGKAFKKMERLRTLIIRKYHFSKAPIHLPFSLRVLEWWRYPSQELPSDFDSERLVIQKISHRVLEVSHTFSQRVGREVLQISKRVFQDEKTWRLVGLVSSVVGLLCYALSPSFNRLIGGWNSFKFFLYGMLSLVIFTTILFAEQSSLSTQHVQLKPYMNFTVLMIISVYSFLYDRAVNGKPEILSLVSNAAFALVSLSLSKLIKFGFEMGIFSYFLCCLTVQLLTINQKLILVAIIFGCPLYVLHSSSDSRPEAEHRGQAIQFSLDSESEVYSSLDSETEVYSSLDSETEVDSAEVIHSSSSSDPVIGNAGQATYSTSNYQPEVDNGSQVIHSYSDSRLELSSGGQHVIDIREASSKNVVPL